MVSFSNSAKKYVSITSFFWLSTSQLPWAMFADKKNFLGVVVYTLTKDGVEGRRRSCVNNRFLFSANTWGPGANVLQRLRNLLHRF